MENSAKFPHAPISNPPKTRQVGRKDSEAGNVGDDVSPTIGGNEETNGSFQCIFLGRG